MTSQKELLSRLKDFFTFTSQERNSLALAVLVMAFIFSFRDWGEEVFSLSTGLRHFFLMLLVVAIGIFFRLSCQKIYALSNGYQAEFKVWWMGIAISLVLAFLTLGKVPSVILGGITSTFMTRQRLGEFRYGHSYWQSGIISLWAVYSSLILAILFAVGKFALPESYFFSKGVFFNLIMAFCAVLPLPQLEGLQVFFAARWMLGFAFILIALASVLLLTNTLVGLVIAITGGAVIGIFYLLISSGK